MRSKFGFNAAKYLILVLIGTCACIQPALRTGMHAAYSERTIGKQLERQNLHGKPAFVREYA